MEGEKVELNAGDFIKNLDKEKARSQLLVGRLRKGDSFKKGDT